MQHDALDAATQGFIDALNEALPGQVKIVEKNASGDSVNCSTIVNGFVSDGVDLIMANATPALTAAASATSDIPILGTSITAYGVALDMDDFTGTVGGNISGTSDLADLEKQAAMITEWFPEAKKVALLFCSAEPNSRYQIEEVAKYLADAGIETEEYAFTDTNDVASVAQAACDYADVIYIPTDNTAAANTEAIANVLIPAGVGGSLLRLRRSYPVHQLLRSGQDHRSDGCQDSDRRGGYLRHAHRIHQRYSQIQSHYLRSAEHHSAGRLHRHRGLILSAFREGADNAAPFPTLNAKEHDL